jgi:flagellar basal-body rod protein FlgB
MQIGGLSLFQALGEKMRWHQTRQGVLAENVANADTPNYIERDLEAVRFDGGLKSTATLTTSATSPMHIAVSSNGLGRFDADSAPFEITPSGNGVTLEDEMMKVAGNDMDYQAVTALYTRSIRLIKTAIGRSA